ncbi:arabinosyltransferase EmbC [Rhodococcus aerolatus]
MALSVGQPTRGPADDGPAPGEEPTLRGRRARSRAALLATVLGLLGAVLALAAPLLPVTQTTARLSWPQAGSLTPVTAPLVGYAPVDLRVTVPCAAITPFATSNGVAVSTVPPTAPGATTQGMIISVVSGSLTVVQRDDALLTTPVAGLAPGCTLVVEATRDGTTATVGTTTGPVTGSRDGDNRPQVVGVFTDLTGAVPDGLALDAQVDTRYATAPTGLKLAALVVGGLAVLGSLAALAVLESDSRTRRLKVLPRGWWRLGPRDLTVVAVLGVWHVIGANTSDDGYLLTMARAARSSGYMGNYFRWFGSPEAPFGWYYEVLAWMARVSTASVWVRLPALVIAVATWLVISREVLPRLGRAVGRSGAARWAAAAVFLAFWLPYDNGLRPEAPIALGVLLTWCSVERAVATRKLLPLAVALLVAAFSLAAGPTGLICLVALLVGLRPLVRLISLKARELGRWTTLAPLLAAGLGVLLVVFGDQTLAAVLEATRVRDEQGPSLAWYQELSRYTALFNDSADGSLARRFPVLVVLLSLAACAAVSLRRGGIPGAARGPSQRLVALMAGSFLALALTPTKWTHHFGAFAGIGGSLAALTALAVGAAALRSRRNRLVFAAALVFVLALSATGWNAWWYVSGLGIPWFDKPPSVKGFLLSTALLAVVAVLVLLAAREHLRGAAPARADGGRARTARLGTRLRGPRAGRRALRLASAPLTVVAGLMVVAEVLAFAKAAVDRYPAYTVGSGNVAALAGNPCALADSVLVETDPLSGLLSPDVGGPDPLGRVQSTGFTPNAVSPTLDGGTTSTSDGSGSTDASQRGTAGSGSASSSASLSLPFGLDPSVTPVLGSYVSGIQQTSTLTSAWYALPPRDAERPLLVVTAAGSVRSVDADGNVTPGPRLTVEFGTGAVGSIGATTSTMLLDPGPTTSWRNLRLPLDQAPPDATWVRLKVVDDDLSPDSWIALTGPRVPQLQTLQQVVGSEQPVLLDWAVGLAFPCQRPFRAQDGVAEVPALRITPNRELEGAVEAWEGSYGGGPLGWTDLLAKPQTVPTYLRDDWNRDWGTLQQLVPIVPSAVPAQVERGTETTGGLSSTGPMWLPDPRDRVAVQ